ncbi:hypothetical protein [Commensalibacter oyaizuii]|uniref:Uncharacterized protein n=1 Tax=Commensalibacter oyaizuii TaxID=3043873 RepID=A0ABT6Q395_9PROT|nr:hypothetical protein [Commensalibacter sp. TBRC 16381]MDI2091596.1 hypothetical protein [Commensalibacter sp. TBRC 16381]
MKMIDKLLTLCFKYCEFRKITIVTLSIYIFNYSRTLNNLKNGGTITVRNYERAVEWLSDHWPENYPWPDFIQRPVKERVEG